MAKYVEARIKGKIDKLRKLQRKKSASGSMDLSKID